MVYAAGRPLWHLSLAWQPMRPLEKWNRSDRRVVEMLMDRVMSRLGTKEDVIPDHTTSAMQWRKPLSVEEINQMAPTPEVRARPGRP